MLDHWSPALTGSVTTKKDRCAEVEECRDNIYDVVVVEEADGQLPFGVAGGCRGAMGIAGGCGA